MPRLAPISRRELVYRLKKLGFEGPFRGGEHDFMRRARDGMKLPVPRGDAKSREIGVGLQKKMLLEMGVSREEWMNL
jgi:predicted RNA binding protein YcfA (HicA-like mRNA interferase family)